MAFASSLFCSSKFLEHPHTLTKRLTVLACSDDTKDVRTPSVFLAHFTLMLDFFFYGKILVGDIEGGAKKLSSKKKNIILVFVFFFWAQVFVPPSELRPKRPDL